MPTMVDGTVCGVHTCGVPTCGMKEQPLGPVYLGTVWVSAVEWVWPSRADGCFSVNTWNELGGSMKIFVTYQFHPKLHFNPTPLRSEEHTSELQSHLNLVCRLLLEK